MEAATQPQRDAAEQRYHALDVLRAGLMLLGLAFHCATSYTSRSLGAAWPYNEGGGSRFFDGFVLYLHLFRMPAFFVLSGFFAAMLCERRGLAAFVRNRALRVGLPLLVCWPVAFPLAKSGFVFALHAHDPGAWPMAAQALHWPLTAFDFAPGSFASVGWMHLWFLYYLLLFYAAAVGLRLLLSRWPAKWRVRGEEQARAGFRRLLWSRLRVVWCAIPTFAILAAMPLGILETDSAFLPVPRSVAVYALFFGFGWLWHRERDLLDVGAKSAAGAVVASVPLTLVLLVTLLQTSPQFTLGLVNRFIIAACGALVSWLLIFAFVGWAVRHAARPNRVARYLSDASYWLYLVHLPVVVWLVALLARTAWPCGVKFSLALAATLTLTLATYNWLVRPTQIGLILNGRRHRSGLPSTASLVPADESSSDGETSHP